DTESSALQVLRIIQEEAMKENSAAIHVQAPVDVAAFLLNEKRGEILKIETRHRVSVILIPNKYLETPHYKLERLKHDDPRLEDMQASYDMAEQAETDIGYDKRQKEEAKPRQEAMVKSITPDQPAPIVERKAPEAAPIPAPVVQEEEGFLSRLFGLFRKKAVVPPPAPAPVVVAKPESARERSDRNARTNGQRGRTRGARGGRERDEAGKPETRGEAAMQSVAAVPAAAQPAQPARPPRPPREPREPKEPREGGEARRERAPRAPREERKPAAAAVEFEASTPAEETLPLIAPIAAEEVQQAAVQALAAETGAEQEGLEAPVSEAGEAGEEGDDQPRRRRRRGGRNRNRRERENGEFGEAGEELEAGAAIAGDAAAISEEQALVQAGAEAAPAEAAPNYASAEPVMASAPVEAQEPAAVAVPEAAEVVEAPAAADEAVAVQAATIDTEAAAVAQPEAAQPEAATPPVVEPAQPETVSVQEAPQAVEAVPAEPEPAPAQASVDSRPVEQAAPAAQAPTLVQPAAVKPAQSAMPLPELNAMLNEAGLTLASTDPEKLRAAQEAAARIQPAPRVPRERKPLPPAPSEPLVQVETQR
ncbi:MAG: ribonuclease E/G, partial [Noviherbaspirillum sp.]